VVAPLTSGDKSREKMITTKDIHSHTISRVLKPVPGALKMTKNRVQDTTPDIRTADKWGR
jgi:hypothetical protein